MHSSIRLCFLFSVLFSIQRTAAINPADSLTALPARQLSEVRIQGTSPDKKEYSKGFQVSTVSLEKSYNYASSLLQTLKQTAGLRVREQGGMGSDYQLSLNGFTGNQVKVFLDGMPLENAGGASGLNALPVGMAERIDIYQGVLPVQLGSDALGGGINIVTRKQSNYLDLSLSAGSFNSSMLSLNGAKTLKNGLVLRSSVFRNSSDNNYRVFTSSRNLETFEKEPPAWYRRFHDGYTALGGTFEAGLKDKSWADIFAVNLSQSFSDKEIQTGETMDVVYGAMTTYSSNTTTGLRYRKSRIAGHADLAFQASYNRSEFQLTDTTARIYNWSGASVADPTSDGSVGGERLRSRNQNKEHQSLTNLTLTLPVNKAGVLSFNHRYADFFRKSNDSENPSAPANRFPSSYNKNIFGLDWSSTLSNKFRASIFGKYYVMVSTGYHTVDAFTENEHTEKLLAGYNKPGYGSVLRWTPDETFAVRASFEHTIRLPEAYELFGDGVFVSYAANLKPESSNNSNLELSGVFPVNKSSLEARLQLIHRRSKDFIRLNQSVSGGNRVMENKGNVQTLGASLILSFTNSFSQLNTFATYQSVTDQQRYEESSGMTGGKTKNVTYGYRLPNIPFLFGGASAGLFHKLGKGTIRFDYDLQAVHSFYLVYSELGLSAYNKAYIIPGQWSHDLRLSWNPGGNHRLSAACTNLTDELLYDSYRMQKPGRSITLTYRYLLTL